jgi:hypothetical protein
LVSVIEEHRLRVFGPKRDEMTEEWKKLHNEEYFSPSIIRIIKLRRMMDRACSTNGVTKRNTYRLLVGKTEGKRPLGRPRRT